MDLFYAALVALLVTGGLFTYWMDWCKPGWAGYLVIRRIDGRWSVHYEPPAK